MKTNNNEIRFTESYITWLPADIYNKVWRWWYMLRKSIARKIKLYFYFLKKDFTQPRLWLDE